MAESEHGKKKIFLLLKRIAFVSGMFSLIVCCIILLNYFQFRTVNPLNSPVLEELVQSYRENPGNEKLKEEIRGLDLLTRKAFFTQQWQIRTGGYLLTAGLAILLISLSINKLFKSKIPQPGKEPVAEKIRQSRFFSRIGIALIFSGIIITTFVVLLYSDNFLASYTEDIQPAEHLEEESSEEESSLVQDFPTYEVLFENWPSFRGPFGNGIAGNNRYPVKWDGKTGENILWKTRIPRKGFNSPIAWENRLFLSGADEEAREVYCLDTGSGEILWQIEVDDLSGDNSTLPEVSDDTGYAAPGMATDGKSVFALFATGMLVCLDFNGSLLWSGNLGVPGNLYGHSSSLITYQNMLFIQYDQEEGGALMAIDTKNGDFIWKTDREVLTSWASPIIAHNDGQASVVLNANPFVAAYDPFSGKELWKVDCMMGEVAPSCASGCGYVYAVNQFASLVAINPLTAEIEWEFYDDLPNVSSPLVIDTYIFLATNYGVITCLDCRTGDVLWVQEYDEGFYSSPIYADKRVYVFDMKGRTHIFEASGKYVSINTPELSEKTVATPAFHRGFIYIRGDDHLFCIGGSKE